MCHFLELPCASRVPCAELRTKARSCGELPWHVGCLRLMWLARFKRDVWFRPDCQKVGRFGKKLMKENSCLCANIGGDAVL